MRGLEEKHKLPLYEDLPLEIKKYFDDMNGKFRAYFRQLVPIETIRRREKRTYGYLGFILVEYDRDVMRNLKEGMFLVAPNFQCNPVKGRYSFTIFETLRILPRHFGLEGLHVGTYYPFQTAIMAEVAKDWETTDTSTKMVSIEVLPINYDINLVIDKNENKLRISFEKQWTNPILGAKVWLLGETLLLKLYNGSIPESVYKLKLDEDDILTKLKNEISAENPRIGVSRDHMVPIILDYRKLVGYHFGVFAYTGAGKSNNVANIVRKILHQTDDVKVVIFDVASEYIFLLSDILLNEHIGSMILTTEEIGKYEELYNSTVKPDKYTKGDMEKQTLELFEQVFEKNKPVKIISPRQLPFLEKTYGDLISDLEKFRDQYRDKPAYWPSIELLLANLKEFMKLKGKTPESKIGSELKEYLEGALNIIKAVDKQMRSSIASWITGLNIYVEIIGKEQQVEVKDYTVDKISDELDELGSKVRLYIIHSPNIEDILAITRDLVSGILRRRRKGFKIKPYVLFVFDEAQEFIPQRTASELQKEVNRVVEELLRQGRKYGLGACIATQRVAYLNTTAIQQLHTFFVGTIPRHYDRKALADAFPGPEELLDETLTLNTGEWLLMSYVATGLKDIPIFLKADNTEDIIDELLKTIK